MKLCSVVLLVAFVPGCGSPQKTAHPQLETTQARRDESSKPSWQAIRFEYDGTHRSAYLGDKQIYEDVEEHEEPDGEDECVHHRSRDNIALSHVGPLFIYCWTEWQESACGYPTPYDGCEFVDQSRRSSELSKLVDLASLLSALKEHPELGDYVENVQSLPEAFTILAKEGYPLEDFWFVNMPNAHSVTMSMKYVDAENSTDIIDHYCEVKLVVEPRPEFLGAFRDAASGKFGFLSENAPAPRPVDEAPGPNCTTGG